MVVLLKEGAIARRAERGRGAGVADRAGLAAGPARGPAWRAALRPRAVPRRVRLGSPALPAGVAAAAAGRVRRVHLLGGALVGGAGWSDRGLGRLPRRAPDRDPGSRHRGGLGLLDAALPRRGRLRRAAGAVARPEGQAARVRRPRGIALRDGRVRVRVRLVAARDAAAVDRRAAAGGPDRRRAGGPRRPACSVCSSPRRCGASLPPPRVARIACVGAFALLVGVAVSAGHQARARRARARRAHGREPGAAARGARDRAARARRTPPTAPTGSTSSPGPAATTGWSTACARSATACIARPSRFRCTATGRSGLRLNRGRERGAVAMRLPVDPGLPNAQQTLPASLSREQFERAMERSAGAELPAPASFSRPFGDDNLIVLRETKGDVPVVALAAGHGPDRASLGALRRRAHPRARADGASFQRRRPDAGLAIRGPDPEPGRRRAQARRRDARHGGRPARPRRRDACGR